MGENVRGARVEVARSHESLPVVPGAWPVKVSLDHLHHHLFLQEMRKACHCLVCCMVVLVNCVNVLARGHASTPHHPSQA